MINYGNSNIKEIINGSVKILTESKTYTVGGGGGFSKLSDALAKALEYISVKNNCNINIILKSGYKLNEQIILRNALANHINILSEDDEVLLNNFDTEKYIFMFYGCKAPNIKIMVNAIGTKAKGWYFRESSVTMVPSTSNAYKYGIKNCYKNAVLSLSSKIVISKYSFTNNGNNLDGTQEQSLLYCNDQGELTGFDLKLDNNGSENCNGWLYYCGYGSKMTLTNTSITNNKSAANILNNNNSYMNLQYPNFTGSKAANLLLCYNGAHTNITGRNVTNCTWSKYELPFATNTVTANGIIHA